MKINERIQSAIHEFIVSGVFCEADTLDGAIRSQLQELSISLLVMMAWSETRVYTTLTRVFIDMERVKSTELDVNSTLALSDLLTLHEGNTSLEKLTEKLSACFAKHAERVQASDLSKSARIYQDTGRSSAASIFIVAWPSAIVEQDAKTFGKILQMLINTHPAVVISRAADDRQRIDQRVATWMNTALTSEQRELNRVADHMSLQGFGSALLEEACELTGSQVGRLFVPARTVSGLKLLIATSLEKEGALLSGSRGQEIETPQADLEQKITVQQYCGIRKRPLVFRNVQDIPRAYANVYSEGVVLCEGSEVVAEMAVPILRYGLDTSPLWGVIELFRKGRPYSEQDLASVEHLTEAYREHGTHVLSDLTATFLTRIQRTTLSEKVWNSNTPVDVPEGFQLSSSSPTYAKEIPPECERLQAMLDEVLVGLFTLTPSCYINIRVISGDSKSLVRLRCLHPKYLQSQSSQKSLHFDSIELGDVSSVTAWCVVNGSTVSVQDNRTANWYSGYPGLVGGRSVSEGTVSSYTSPILMLGRVIGSLHLESVYPNAFEDSQAFIDAVAATIGAAVSCSRRIMEGDTLYRRSKRAAIIHQLAPEIANLKNTLEAHFQAQPSRFAKAKSQLNSCQNLIQNLDSESFLLVNNLRELIDGIVRFHGLYNVRFSEEKLFAEVRLHRRIAGSVEIAITELLRNAHKYRRLVGGEQSVILISESRRRLGGDDYLVISIENKTVTFPEETRRYLFRSAIRKDRKSITSRSFGYGCLSASSLVNQFGGEIYLDGVKENSDDSELDVIVCIDIPAYLVEPLGSSGEDES